MKILYHGTRVRTIDQLDVVKCSASSPFGRAIYLTDDPSVACYYTGNTGCVFEVSVDGDWDMVINFDLPFCQQSRKVQDLIQAIASRNNLENKHISSVRRIVHRQHLEKENINNHLRSLGVWMICGKLEAMELSGPMDRGIQYAILLNENVSINGVRYF